MPYQIAACATFMSDLVASPRTIQNKFKQVIENLQVHPTENLGKRTKKLHGYQRYWRYALENPEYRIIYEVDQSNNSVKLLMMGPRKDDAIYKRLGNYVPDKGPSQISINMIPAMSPEYMSTNLNMFTGVQLTAFDGDNTEKLPEINDKLLESWHVDEQYWDKIKECKSEQDLLNVDIPQFVKLRLMDCLWPSSIDNVINQPTYIIKDDDDLKKAIDGELTKLLLNLDREQISAIAQDLMWPILIKGGPGTGKTIVALYKACQMATGQTTKGETVLFTTYTNALINSSRQLFESYLGSDNKLIKIRTINSVAASICKMNDINLKFVTEDDKVAIIERIYSNEKRKQLPQQIDVEYLIKEIEWIIEGRVLKSFEEYKSIKRKGRIFRLTESQRKIIWDIYEDFRAVINKQGKTTYEEAQALALNFAENVNRGGKAWKFNYVIIDEAQDIKPVGIRLCSALCKTPGTLYLTADTNQSIYGKGISWRNIAGVLNFNREHIRQLKNNYRSTDQIIRAASDIIAGLENIDKDTINTNPVYTGPKPMFFRFKNENSRNETMANWLRTTLRELRLSYGCAAILCVGQNSMDKIMEVMKNQNIPVELFKKNASRLDSPTVKVMTIHGSKGLEYPVIVIPDFRVDAFYGFAPDDIDARLEIAKKLNFVAITRAMKRVMVAVVGNSNDSLARAVTETNWDIRS